LAGDFARHDKKLTDSTNLPSLKLRIWNCSEHMVGQKVKCSLPKSNVQRGKIILAIDIMSM